MTISALQQPADVQLKVVNVNKAPNAKATPGVASSKIFAISFGYEQKAYRTKVMKVLYANKDALYKVVMPCSLNNGTTMHWLQRQEGNWAVMMGAPLESKLLKAVTSAIDTLE